jgi:hypothetical protein
VDTYDQRNPGRFLIPDGPHLVEAKDLEARQTEQWLDLALLVVLGPDAIAPVHTQPLVRRRALLRSKRNFRVRYILMIILQ